MRAFARKYRAWRCPVYKATSLEAAVDAAGKSDGIYRLGAGSASIDVLMTGSNNLAAGDRKSVLVCLNGLVIDRKRKHPPFFGGRGVAKALHMPVLSIDDPTVGLSDDVGLSWYAGNEDVPELVSLIADYLNCFAERHHCRLIFMGGSGGGFGVMSVLRHIQVEASALVWNPQTNISKYRPEFVLAYLRVAFPNLMLKRLGEIEGEPSQSELAAMLAQAGVAFDITDWTAPAHVSLLYLQNSTDWHVAAHAVPFMASGTWERLGKRSFHSKDRGVACWFGAWGVGHAAPPAAVIQIALSRLGRGMSVSAIATQLDAECASQYGSMPWFQVDGTPVLCVQASRDGDIVRVETALTGNVSVDAPYEYAYYLYRDGERKAVSRYTSSPVAQIFCPGGEGRESVLAFVKDAFGATVKTSIALPG